MCALDAEHVAAVLEDCVDQLAVLGSIISIPDNPANTETVSTCLGFVFSSGSNSLWVLVHGAWLKTCSNICLR